MAKKSTSTQRKTEVTATATPYEVGLWKGMPQYKCLLCSFDTLSEDEIFAHIEEHRLGEPKAKPSVLVADKRGKQVDPADAPPQGEGDVFEVELKEIGSSVDECGDEHKTFTVKE